jgi:putative membrane protein
MNATNSQPDGRGGFVALASMGSSAQDSMSMRRANLAGSSDGVRKFGQRTRDDHGKANEQMEEPCPPEGVTVPGDLSAKDKPNMARLEKLQGDQFDRAYIKDMVADHEKDVAEVKSKRVPAPWIRT